MNNDLDNDERDNEWDVNCYRKRVASGTFSLIQDKKIKCNKLYVGDISTSYNLKGMIERGITSVISLGCENTKYKTHPNINYHRIIIPDIMEVNIVSYFLETFKFIDVQEGNVLIHCFAGISRSVTIAIAYLMYSENLSYLESLDIVRKCRSCALPNIGFSMQLMFYENNKMSI